MPGVSKLSNKAEFIFNGKYVKRKNKQESQKIRQKFNKQQNKCTKIISRKKYRQKKNGHSCGRIKLKLYTTAMTRDYSNDCIQEFLERNGILPSICDNDFFGYNSEPGGPIFFCKTNAYKCIIDDIWINIIIFYLDIYDLLSLTQTCCDLNKLLTRNITQNVYWKIKCGLLLDTSFIPRDNVTDKNGESETFHQCFKPFNNDWKQFYIEMKKVFSSFSFYKDVHERSTDPEENLERLICRHGSAFLIESCDRCHMQMIKFLLDMNIILVRRDELKCNSRKYNGVSTNKISFHGPYVFRFVFRSQRDDYGMLKFILNHETMLYKDPKTLMYPIESKSIIASIIRDTDPRLLQIFFSKEFNLSIRSNIFNPSGENHAYQIDLGVCDLKRVIKGGLLQLGCQLWTGYRIVNRFKCLLSCKDMDLSNQINETLFFHLVNNGDLKSDERIKMFRFLLAKTCNCNLNDNINDSDSDGEYMVRDIYADKLANIDIIHTRDCNGNSLFYECAERVTIKVDALKFLYDYAINMNQQFGEKYCRNDIYRFINNIIPKTLLNKESDYDNYNNSNRVNNLDQFWVGYYLAFYPSYSTFRLVRQNGYASKMTFLRNYCQPFIDVNLWVRFTKIGDKFFHGNFNVVKSKKNTNVHSSFLALKHKQIYGQLQSAYEKFRDADTAMISNEMLQLVIKIGKGYQYYGMKMVFPILCAIIIIVFFFFPLRNT